MAGLEGSKLDGRGVETPTKLVGDVQEYGEIYEEGMEVGGRKQKTDADPFCILQYLELT